MTLTEAQAMTPEQRRVKLAELMGWKRGDRSTCAPPIPDYCNDLNAVHEAESTLTGTQFVLYDRNIRDVCWAEGEDGDDVINRIRATADQRTTAIILTLFKA